MININKKFNIWLSKVNIPYVSNSNDRPSFMDYKGNLNRAKFIDYHFGTSADYIKENCEGKYMTFTSFDTATFRISASDYAKNPAYKTWIWDDFFRPNACMIWESTNTDTPRFWFITKITPTGNDMIEYTLSLDYWLTYWYNGKYSDVSLDNTKSVLVQRRHEQRYKVVEFIQEQWMIEIPAGKTFTIAVIPSYNWEWVYAGSEIQQKSLKQMIGKYSCYNCDPVYRDLNNFIECSLSLIGENGKVVKNVVATKDTQIGVNGENFIQVLTYTAGENDETYYGFEVSTFYKNNWGGTSESVILTEASYQGCCLSMSLVVYDKDSARILEVDNSDITWNIQITGRTITNARSYDPENYITGNLWVANEYAPTISDADILYNLTTTHNQIEAANIEIVSMTGLPYNYIVLTTPSLPNPFVGFMLVKLYFQKGWPQTIYSEALNFENNIPLPSSKVLCANLFTDSIINNVDPTLNHLECNNSYLQLKNQNFERKISEVQSYSQNILFATSGKESTYNQTQSYCYALVTFLSNLGAPGGSKMPTIYSSWTQPLMLCPIVIGSHTTNSYSDLLAAGSNAVVKIFMTDFPLISDKIWNDTSKYNTIDAISGGKYAGIGNTMGVFIGDIINDLYVIEKGVYKETYDLRDLPFEIFVPLKTPQYKAPYNHMYEVNLYTYPFTKIELINGPTNREIRLNSLWGNSLDYINNIDITCRYVMNETLFNKIGFINNGTYGLASDTTKSAYICSAGYDLPCTGNAYTNFYQLHLNSYNTSKWALGMRLGTDAITKGIGGAVAGGTVGSKIGPEGLVGGALFGFASTMVNSISNFAVQNTQLNSQIADLERQPMSLSHISNGDIYSMVSTTKDIFNKSGSLTSTPNTYLNVMFHNEATAKSIAYYFHINGNICNKYEKLDNYSLNLRSIFNYWKIDRIQSGLNLNNIPNQVIQWFNNLFNHGIRLWNYDINSTDPDALWYQYNIENWENALLVNN